MILAPLLKLPKNVGDLGKFIVAKGFKKLPKVQKIANSGHTDCNARFFTSNWIESVTFKFNNSEKASFRVLIPVTQATDKKVSQLLVWVLICKF